jgi:hypothetical protein
VPEAQGTSVTLLATAGVDVHLLMAMPSRPFGVSARIEYVLERLSLTHVSPDTTSSVRSRWISGAEVVADLRWLFASNVEALAGIGAKDVFSTTYVSVQGNAVATLPPLALLGEAGIQVRF